MNKPLFNFASSVWQLLSIYRREPYSSTAEFNSEKSPMPIQFVQPNREIAPATAGKAAQFDESQQSQSKRAKIYE